jgi:hypothetical protein
MFQVFHLDRNRIRNRNEMTESLEDDGISGLTVWAIHESRLDR